jgi:hypothetical protein
MTFITTYIVVIPSSKSNSSKWYINVCLFSQCKSFLHPRSWRGVLDTTLYDEGCQWLAAGRLFSPGFLHQHIAKILLRVALNAIYHREYHHYLKTKSLFIRIICILYLHIANIITNVTTFTLIVKEHFSRSDDTSQHIAKILLRVALNAIYHNR